MNNLKYFLLNGYQEYNQMVMTGGASPSGPPSNNDLESQLTLFLAKNSQSPELSRLLTNIVSKMGRYDTVFNVLEQKEEKRLNKLETFGFLETLDQITQSIINEGDDKNAGDAFTESMDFVYYAPINEPDFKNLQRLNTDIIEKGQKLGTLLQFTNKADRIYSRYNNDQSKNYLFFSELPSTHRLIYTDSIKTIQLLKVRT